MTLEQMDGSPTLHATDRTDRTTCIAQGLAKIPEEVLKYDVRRYAQEEGDR